jgi:uncharacterized RDD family membrane protein YckC
VLASSQTDAAAAGTSAGSSSGTWQPEPAATSQGGVRPDPLGQSGRSASGARGYAQSPATPAQPQPQPQQQRTPVVAQPQYAQSPAPPVQPQYAQPQQYAQAQEYAQPQQYPQVAHAAQVAQPQIQPQQYVPRQAPVAAPAPVPAPAVTPAAVPTPVPAPAAEPEREQVPESVATMIVPSAFAPSQRTGTYRLPGNINNPFAGLPGMPSFAAAAQEDEEGAQETTVVELATPGSRFLGRIIDFGIAAIFSAPITVTLLLIAHRHDHQYVLKLDAQATTTYTTLGMDALGIALWAGALLAFVVISIVYEGYRLGRGGQTFGKRLAGVRVVSLADGSPLSRGGAGTRRALLFWVLAIIPVLDVLALGGMFWGRPYRQGVHEKATSTVTVKA